jgi:hypothetical protein
VIVNVSPDAVADLIPAVAGNEVVVGHEADAGPNVVQLSDDGLGAGVGDGDVCTAVEVDPHANMSARTAAPTAMRGNRLLTHL